MAAELSKLAVGDKITIKNGAYNISPYKDGAPNGKFASFVYNMEFTVMQVGLGSDKNKRTNYVAFGIPGKGYTGAVAVEDIAKVKYTTVATPVTKAADTTPPKTDPAPEQPKTPSDPYSPPERNIIDANGGPDKSNHVVFNGSHYRTGGKSFEDATSHLGSRGKDATMEERSLSQVSPNSISTTERLIEKGTIVDKKTGASHDVRSSSMLRNPAIKGKDSVAFAYPSFSIVEDEKTGRTDTVYDYTIDVNKIWTGKDISMDNDPLAYIESLHGIPTSGRRETFKNLTNHYFRFRKTPNPNAKLSKGFAHIFFTRPDLNVLNYDGSGVYTLPIACESDSSILYAYKNNPDLLKSLVLDNGMTHDFMFLLSNTASSFSVLQDVLSTDNWGATWTGHTVTYGKHNHENKCAGEIQISYIDDRNLNIYHLHKIWLDYIAKVYRGELIPRGMTLQQNELWAPVHGASPRGNGAAYSYAANKILDYATSIYYIVTAEDGESIIFWSKYYGVFPTNAPSDAFGWSSGEAIKNPKFEITYKYSFKQDYEPYNLAEFNWLSNLPETKLGDNPYYQYVKTYNSSLLGAGTSKVGTPFIETVVNKDADEPYQFKLRFRPPTEPGSGRSRIETSYGMADYYKTTKGMKE